MVVVVVNRSWLSGLVVVERWWPLSLSEVMGFAAERVVVVVFGWFGCALVVVGGMLEVVVAVGWAVRGLVRWSSLGVALVSWGADMAMGRAVVVVRLCSAHREG